MGKTRDLNLGGEPKTASEKFPFDRGQGQGYLELRGSGI
jgi:hypothetical protein